MPRQDKLIPCRGYVIFAVNLHTNSLAYAVATQHKTNSAALGIIAVGLLISPNFLPYSERG